MKSESRNILNIMVGWFVLGFTVNGANVTGYFKWSEMPGPVLQCPEFCNDTTEPTECCSCNAVPCWDIPNINVSDSCGVTKASLYLETIDLFGNVLVKNPVKADIYELISTDGQLTTFPSNICDFSSSIVKLDLSFNKISDASPVKCLTELDTLNLDYNNIQTIDNTTFFNMTKLRVLTMKGNKLESMPPNLVKTGDRNIFILDFSFNYLDTVDVTNLFREGLSCKINISHSSAQELVNELGFRINQSVMYGPGDIILEHTSISHFPNFSALGLDWKDLKNTFSGKISLDESSLRCDCNLYPFFVSLGKEVSQFWPNIDNTYFECNSPERMKGENLTSILDKKLFDKLTCDLENCPYKGLCHCIDMPDADKIVVNCTNAGLDEFPDEMPVGFWNNRNIDLILVGNKIKTIPDRNYMGRLVGLDLRKNDLTETNPLAIQNVNCPVNMADQQLSNLIKQFGLKDPTLIEFGENPVYCDCSNLWIGDWIRVAKAFGRLMCRLEDGSVVPAEDVTRDSLGCDTVIIPVATIVVPFVVLVTIIVLISGLCFIFKYDIMIAVRRWIRRSPASASCFDAFVSFSEENEDAFLFVKDYIRHGLRKAGYSIFIPWFDLDALNTDRDIEVTRCIQQSSTYVVILTTDYLDDFNTAFEFDCLWKNFKNNRSTEIIVINLDFLETKDIKERRLNAFRRTRVDLSFRDRNGTLLERLKLRLGKPRAKRTNKETRADKYVDKEEQNLNCYGLMEVAETGCPLSREQYVEQLQREEHLKEYFSKPVHERLNQKRTTCNCKYRRCYLHAGAL